MPVIARNNLVDVRVLFEKVQLHEAMHVADFGVGRTGHIVFPAAKIIGDSGVVYAVDILKNVLELTQKRAKMEGFLNVHAVWADLEVKNGVQIPKNSLDVIFLVNVLYHFPDFHNTLHEIDRLLKKRGRVVVVDWIERISNIGPPEDGMLDFHKFTQQAREFGFVIQEDFNLSRFCRSLILYRHE